MKARRNSFNLKKIAVLLIFVLGASTVPALADSNDAVTFLKISREESLSLASNSLSKKLRSDLVLKSVSVKFGKIEAYPAADGKIGIKGDATCRLDGEANDLPISFDVKIDASRRAAIDVKYVFLNMEGGSKGAVITPEDVITEKLLERIKSDYKTENIVIAIDSMEGKPGAGGEKEFKGTGEVRVNGLDWKKISFDVKADAEKAQIAVLKYQIK